MSLISTLLFQDCGIQLTDEPDKRCYPLESVLLCHDCHMIRLPPALRPASSLAGSNHAQQSPTSSLYSDSGSFSLPPNYSPAPSTCSTQDTYQDSLHSADGYGPPSWKYGAFPAASNSGRRTVAAPSSLPSALHSPSPNLQPQPPISIHHMQPSVSSNTYVNTASLNAPNNQHLDHYSRSDL